MGRKALRRPIVCALQLIVDVGCVLPYEKYLKKSDIIPAYNLLVKKSPLLTPDECKLINSRINANLKEGESFEYFKDIDYKPIKTLHRKFKISDKIANLLNLKSSPKLIFSISDFDKDSLIISSKGRYKIIIKKYIEHDAVNAFENAQFINSEFPNIISLGIRPNNLKDILYENDMNEYIKNLSKEKNNKEVNTIGNIVNENVAGMKIISFNDTILLNLCNFVTIQNLSYKNEVTCLLNNLKKEMELRYLAGSINYNEAEKLYLISSTYSQ